MLQENITQRQTKFNTEISVKTTDSDNRYSHSGTMVEASVACVIFILSMQLKSVAPGWAPF